MDKNLIKIFSFFFVALTFMGCTEKKTEYRRPPVKVTVFTVNNGSGEHTQNYVGTVEEDRGSVLSFEVPGNVVSLKAEAGDRVRKGQLLGMVNSTTLKENHRIALNALSQAQDTYKRMKPLHEQGVISDMKWVEVENALRQAEAAENIARQQLGHSSLYAPYSGVISSRDVEIGTNVMAGQGVYKLVDLGKLVVKVSIPENEIAHVCIGQKAYAIFDNLKGGMLVGDVSEKGVSANPISHTYEVKIMLNNANKQLMPGMVCKVMLKQSVATHNNISVPKSALELDTDNTVFVWIVKNGAARKRTIAVGDFTESGVEVENGVSSGDQIIVEGKQKVSEGTVVTVR